MDMPLNRAALGSAPPRRRPVEGTQEVADHAEVQGFAEAPGAGDEVHLAGMINKIGDKMGFIDKITAFTDEFLEIGDALFQFLFHTGF